jgi:predicted alpha/beta hydrolase family esterase
MNDPSLKETANKFINRYAFLSNNDPYIPGNVLKTFAELIESNITIIPNAGHFNKSSGFTSFPKLLELLLKI